MHAGNDSAHREMAQDPAPRAAPAARAAPAPSLLRRLFVANALVLVAAFSLLAFSPLTLTSPLSFWEGGLYSIVGLTAVLVVNWVLMRRSVGPLTELARSMRHADPLRPGLRAPVQGDSAEVMELGHAFNEMLDRLERERRDSVRRTLAAQESERLQLARELHDEVGQGLTALMLQLDYVARSAPPELAGELRDARESARAGLEEVRRMARRLRPEALDDLGLASAIADLTDRFERAGQISVSRHLDRELPPLGADAELVVYRVAQESLTNVVRHAGAGRAEVSLTAAGDRVRLRVADDGRGLNGAGEGAGMKGMRERAVLVGADLDWRPRPGGGVELTLDVPADGAGDARGD